MSDKHTAAEGEAQPSERAAENIAAWEKKRAAQRTAPSARDEPSDDAEAGGP